MATGLEQSTSIREIWRPDNDEVCLTTTTIQRSGSTPGGTSGETHSIDRGGRDGITMTKRFEWDEAMRR